jgi:transcriptional regulator with XRE-family HTH domain
MRAPSKPLNQDREAVREARQAAKVTQYRLAKQLGVARSLISEIEKGTRNAQPELLRRMAAIFDCPVSQIEARPAAASADVDVQQVRDAERAVPQQMPRVS